MARFDRSQRAVSEPRVWCLALVAAFGLTSAAPAEIAFAPSIDLPSHPAIVTHADLYGAGAWIFAPNLMRGDYTVAVGGAATGRFDSRAYQLFVVPEPGFAEGLLCAYGVFAYCGRRASASRIRPPGPARRSSAPRKATATDPKAEALGSGTTMASQASPTPS